MVIADVAGKGPPAAVVASMVRYSIRTAASEGQNPPQIAATASRLLHLSRDETNDRFATAVIVEISAVGDDFNVQVTVAGHPPALVGAGGKLADWLGFSGPILGIDGDQRYKSRSSRLSSGDVVALYTDGLSEARTAAGFIGEQGIQQALVENLAEPAESIVAALATLATSATTTDDIAVLVLKVS